MTISLTNYKYKSHASNEQVKGFTKMICLVPNPTYSNIGTQNIVKDSQRMHVTRTWAATSDWLYVPFLPQSPMTTRLSEPSALTGWCRRWRRADTFREHRLMKAIIHTPKPAMFLCVWVFSTLYLWDNLCKKKKRFSHLKSISNITK